MVSSQAAAAPGTVTVKALNGSNSPPVTPSSLAFCTKSTVNVVGKSQEIVCTGAARGCCPGSSNKQEQAESSSYGGSAARRTTFFNQLPLINKQEGSGIVMLHFLDRIVRSTAGLELL